MPAAGSGGDPSFELRFSDDNGADELSLLAFLVNTSFTEVGGCLVEVALETSPVRLANDSGNGWLGPVPMGMTHTLSHSQSKLTAAVRPPPPGNSRRLYR